MTSADVDELRSAATRLREAFERASGLVSLTFSGFPRGSCGDAAVLLGQYLEDESFGEWMYHSGWNEDGWSHGWIEQDGLIVDITADQFEDVVDPVIVTYDRSWHAQFEPGRAEHLSNLAAFHWGRQSLPADYERLREHIRRQQ